MAKCLCKLVSTVGSGLQPFQIFAHSLPYHQLTNAGNWNFTLCDLKKKVPNATGPKGIITTLTEN